MFIASHQLDIYSILVNLHDFVMNTNNETLVVLQTSLFLVFMYVSLYKLLSSMENH